MHPDVVLDEAELRRAAARQAKVPVAEVATAIVRRRSIDARRGRVWLQLVVELVLRDEAMPPSTTPQPVDLPALSGEPPFDDPRTHRLLMRIATEAPPSLGALCPNVPIELVQIVDKALEVDVERRWQSAAEMANALALCGYTSFH